MATFTFNPNSDPDMIEVHIAQARGLVEMLSTADPQGVTKNQYFNALSVVSGLLELIDSSSQILLQHNMSLMNQQQEA